MSMCGWEYEAVSMARFRSGHSLELAGYCRRIGKTEDGQCGKCREEEESFEHVWECEAGRRKGFQLGLGEIMYAFRKPGPALEYWRWWRRARPRAAE